MPSAVALPLGLGLASLSAAILAAFLAERRTRNSRLPRPRGPFPVGTLDVHAGPLLFKAFYPASPPPPDAPRTAEPWLPGARGWPDILAPYMEGFRQSLNLPRIASLFFAPIAFTRLHTLPCAPLLQPDTYPAPFPSASPTPTASSALRRRRGPDPATSNLDTNSKNTSSAPQPPATTPHRLPLVVLSHGILGLRTSYSILCSDLASRGFFVVALEHADGSAPFTVRGADATHVVSHVTEQHWEAEWETHKGSEMRKTGINEDEIKHTKAADMWAWRSEQLQLRINEVARVVRLLKDVDEGTVQLPDCPIDLRGRLDIAHWNAVGHSFGGATALEAALNKSTLPSPARCVALDAWMFPLSPLREDVAPRAPYQPASTAASAALKWPFPCPVLFLNSTTGFQYERAHMQQRAILASREKAESHPEARLKSEIVDIPHASHHVFSDVPHLVPRILRAIVGVSAGGSSVRSAAAMEAVDVDGPESPSAPPSEASEILNAIIDRTVEFLSAPV